MLCYSIFFETFFDVYNENVIIFRKLKIKHAQNCDKYLKFSHISNIFIECIISKIYRIKNKPSASAIRKNCSIVYE